MRLVAKVTGLPASSVSTACVAVGGVSHVGEVKFRRHEPHEIGDLRERGMLAGSAVHRGLASLGRNPIHCMMDVDRLAFASAEFS